MLTMTAVAKVCATCKRSLDESDFSKSQLNKLLKSPHFSITCKACIQSKDDRGDGKSNSSSSKHIQNIVNKSSSPGGSTTDLSDPSTQYLSNPRSAPIVSQFNRFFSNFKKMGVSRPEIYLSKELTGWRTAAKLSVRSEAPSSSADAKRHTVIGLFAPGTHKVIDGTSAAAHHPKINSTLQLLLKCMTDVGVCGYLEGVGEDERQCDQLHCYLKYVLVAVERETSRVQLTLVWNSSRSNAHSKGLLDALVEKLQEQQSNANIRFHSIWVNYHLTSRHNNAITGRVEKDWVLLYGDEYVTEVAHIPGRDRELVPKLCFPPFVFRQANITVFGKIVCDLRPWLETMATVDHNTKTCVLPRCLELYGGVGTIGLNCLDLVSTLICSDENPNNEKCFNASLALLSSVLSNKARYITRKSADLAVQGLLSHTLYDVIIVDPPRKGLEEDVLKVLVNPSRFADTSVSAPKNKKVFDEGGDEIKVISGDRRESLRRLIYISCGFDAFQRDCDVLTGVTGVAQAVDNSSDKTSSAISRKRKFDVDYENATETRTSENQIRWKLVFAKGYLLFPGSNHIETLAVFDRV